MAENRSSKISAEAQAKKRALKERDAQLVRGKFRYLEIPGGELVFPWKIHGEPLKEWKLVDGEVYTLPLGLALHLKNNCWSPEFAHDPVAGVYDAYKMVRKKHRTDFQPTEFKEIAGLEEMQVHSDLFTPEEQSKRVQKPISLQL